MARATTLRDSALDDLYRQGVALFHLGDDESARDRFESAVKEEETRADAAFHLGRIAELRGDARHAKRWYAQAVAAEAAPHYASAKAYLRLASAPRQKRQAAP